VTDLGVPEDPRVAETYYSQFEEFEEDRDTSHESGNSGAVRDSFEGSEGGDEDEEVSQNFYEKVICDFL